jgi:hypothetical protein
MTDQTTRAAAEKAAEEAIGRDPYLCDGKTAWRLMAAVKALDAAPTGDGVTDDRAAIQARINRTGWPDAAPPAGEQLNREIRGGGQP